MGHTYLEVAIGVPLHELARVDHECSRHILNILPLGIVVGVSDLERRHRLRAAEEAEGRGNDEDYSGLQQQGVNVQKESEAAKVLVAADWG